MSDSENKKPRKKVERKIKLVKKTINGEEVYRKKLGGRFVSDKEYIKQEIAAGRAANLKRSNYFKQLPKNLKLSFYGLKRVSEGDFLQSKGKTLSKKQINYIKEEAKRIGKKPSEIVDVILNTKKPPQIKQVRSLWDLWAQSNGSFFDVQGKKITEIPTDVVPDYIINIENNAIDEAEEAEGEVYFILYTVRTDYNIQADTIDVYLLDYEIIGSENIEDVNQHRRKVKKSRNKK